MRANLLMARMAYPESPEGSMLDASKSLLLSSILTCNASNALLFLHPAMKKDPSLGRLFSRIEPDTNSEFTLEVGVELPDLLPNLNGRTDYWVDVKLDESRTRTLCVSNQMMRIDLIINDAEKLVIMPRYRTNDLKSEQYPITIDENTPTKYLKTMVSSQYTISGEDAEDALELNIGNVIDSFLESINVFLQANQMLASGDEYPALPSGYDQTNLDYLYLALFGKSIHVNAFQRLTLNPGKVQLKPRSIDGTDADKLIAFLNGAQKFDDVHLMMSSAKNALDGGMIKFSLLQMVIAAEMATNRFVKKQLRSRGVSKSKLRKYEREMSYGQMLNVLLVSLAPAGMKPDSELLGQLNRARDCRNTLMHEGKMKMTRDELYSLYTATRNYIWLLSEITKNRSPLAAADKKSGRNNATVPQE